MLLWNDRRRDLASREYLNKTQAAYLIGVTRMTLDRWIKSGKISYYATLGERQVFRTVDILRRFNGSETVGQ